MKYDSDSIELQNSRSHLLRLTLMLVFEFARHRLSKWFILDADEQRCAVINNRVLCMCIFNHSTQNKNKFQENRFVLSRSTYRNVNLIDDDDDYILTSEKKTKTNKKNFKIETIEQYFLYIDE